jgi:hypothetical protein
MRYLTMFMASNSLTTEELCSFDAFLKKYDLDEPELLYLALIVRGADTDRHDLTPESGGLFAISLGLSDMHPGDDQAVLRDGFIVYDAFRRGFTTILKLAGSTSPREETVSFGSVMGNRWLCKKPSALAGTPRPGRSFTFCTSGSNLQALISTLVLSSVSLYHGISFSTSSLFSSNWTFRSALWTMQLRLVVA